MSVYQDVAISLPGFFIKKNDDDTDKLYPLTVLEEDEEKDLVKVSYVCYGSEYDEWRPKKDILHIGEEESGDSSSDESQKASVNAKPRLVLPL